MTTLRAAVLAILLLLGGMGELLAQTPSTLPPGVTQDQFDAMVDAIGKSVTQKLMTPEQIGVLADAVAKAVAEKQKVAPAPAAAKESAPHKAAPSTLATDLAGFFHRAGQAISAIPAFWEHLTAIPGLLDERAQGGRGLAGFLLRLLIVAVLAVGAEEALRRLVHALRARLAAGAAPEKGAHGLVNLGLLILLDGLGVLAVWLIVTGGLGLWFAGTTGQHRLAVEVLMAVFWWRLCLLAFRVLLRPGLPSARLCQVDDQEAWATYRRISVVVLAVIIATVLARLLESVQTPPVAIGAGRLFTLPLFLAVFIWFVVRTAGAARQWFGDSSTMPHLGRFVGRHWIAIMVPFFVILALAQLYGDVTGKTKIGRAMHLTLDLVTILLIFETLLVALLRRLDSALPGWTPASDTPSLADVFARCLRVVVLITIGINLAKTWTVDVLGIVDMSEWDTLTLELRTAGVTLFVAFVLWELVNYITTPHIGGKSGAGRGHAISRLSTLMPLLRVTLGVVIAVLAVLIVLADLGVNIGPLLAGASILGLAVSFGSQALVKDIVSGIFYLTDDAFRVGEYIQCAGTSGIVEGFTLRSIRLRNQNGQVHTIPYGDMGQITNFSRDWSMVKFNFAFPRQVDIEKVRAAADGVGKEMTADPELAPRILEPLRMQGVVEVTNDALVVEFRLSARPGNPGALQRDAMMRMMRALPMLGIEFGTAAAA